MVVTSIAAVLVVYAAKLAQLLEVGVSHFALKTGLAMHLTRLVPERGDYVGVILSDG